MEKYSKVYIDNNREEFVVYTNDEGVSKIQYIKDKLKKQIKDVEDYDKLCDEVYKRDEVRYNA